jgi:hypothetical protein
MRFGAVRIPPLPDPGFASPLGLRCVPWHCSPGCDLRRAPHDRSDFNSNALGEDLFSGSLK